ncbi:MAG TPA: class I SAM-dependent methyltransferase [Rhodocyclaceae bacterium]|nr:class I SAM-dependent methyltransferase [Rhodocyclaceae bacterium]
MHERRFQGQAEKLRSDERIARLEVGRVVQSCLEGLPIQSVLDVGIGTGIFAAAFTGLGAAVTGVDPNLDLLELARHYVPRAVLREATAEHLPFSDDAFDLVFMGHVLHEVDDARKALSEARRVAAMRVSILEWPYRTEELGPPLAHRLAPETIEDMARSVGYRQIDRGRLAHMDLYHLLP